MKTKILLLSIFLFGISISYAQENKQDTNKPVTNFGDNFKLYNLYAGVELGDLYPGINYDLATVNLYVTYLRYDDWYAAAELKPGFAFGSGFFNVILNIAPVIVGYTLNDRFDVELTPDIYNRFYSGGSKTVLGVTGGIKYNFEDRYKVGLRIGGYSGFYMGLNFSYKLNIKK